jgi:hypothetical protein
MDPFLILKWDFEIASRRKKPKAKLCHSESSTLGGGDCLDSCYFMVLDVHLLQIQNHGCK